MALKYDCWTCKKQVTATKNDRYRSHSNGDGEPCEQSSAPIPEHILANPVGADDAPDVPREGVDFAVCPQCDRKVKLTRMGYFEPHDTTLRGGDRCETSGVRAKHARKTETVPLPGDEPLPPSAAVPEVKAQEELSSLGPLTHPGAAKAAEKGEPATDFPESTSTPEPWEQWTEASDSFFLETVHAMLMDAVGSPARSLGPPTSTGAAPGAPDRQIPGFDDLLFQKRSSSPSKPDIPMSERGKELAARLRETFYAYTNRNAKDNRSAQKTLGPSEIGSPCDRQIAMKLLGIEPTNPQEGWAPFVGTAVHAELASMFEWANGSGSGRYVTEMSVSFGNPLVPRGTLDLLDRVLYMVDDHKLMGRWSLDKLRKEGPSETYRKQIQMYGLGAELAGEKVREVAIIGWPRTESSLDKLYVHVEKYDRKIAEAALDRVARIAAEVGYRSSADRDKMTVARSFGTSDRGECKWCPFSSPKDKGFQRGCPGPS